MRRFPETSKDALIAFAFHSTRMERIPISKQAIDETLSGGNPNPYIQGQLACINLVKDLAQHDDFIPTQTFPHTAINELHWLKRIHLNLMKPITLHQEMSQDPHVLPLGQVGQWRETRHFISGLEETIEMPSPFSIPRHLYEWWSDVIEFHNQMREKIELPHLLRDDDIRQLVEKAYESNLRLCCIKPFSDGSNRVARLTENLLRLNFGLPWKIISSEDDTKLEYLDEIKKMQSEYLVD